MTAGRDTVFALSSAYGKAGIAVVRVSGPAAGSAVRALTGQGPPDPRKAVLRRFVDPEAGNAIDRGVLLWFAAPESFTGEDVAEFHIHGGRAVVHALLTALGRVEDARPAEPGEFTRRAFDAGKLDLTAVEGLADLIDAETEAQRRQALRQMEGALGALYGRWREALVRALAHLEAAIDFSDEDVPGDLRVRAMSTVSELSAEIAEHLDDGHRGELLREGFEVVVAGAPNVGKSSLVNAIARRDVAIVAETAGTTRDVIEVRIDLGGYAVTIADTAGLRRAAEGKALDAVEAEGVRRALERAGRADLTILVADGSCPESVGCLEAEPADTLLAINKMDLKGAHIPAAWAGRPCHAISAKTGSGIKDLLTDIEARVVARLAPGPGAAMTRARHRDALVRARAALERAREAVEIELAAEDVRIAARALGRLVGAVDVEDLLDVIFADFCIGK